MKTELINHIFHNNRSGIAVVEGYEKDNETGIPCLYLINYDTNKEELIESSLVWNEDTMKVGYFFEMEAEHECKIVAAKIRNLLHDFNKETISLEFNWE